MDAQFDKLEAFKPMSTIRSNGEKLTQVKT